MSSVPELSTPQRMTAEEFLALPEDQPFAAS